MSSVTGNDNPRTIQNSHTGAVQYTSTQAAHSSERHCQVKEIQKCAGDNNRPKSRSKATPVHSESQSSSSRRSAERGIGWPENCDNRMKMSRKMILVPENRFKEFLEWERRERGDDMPEDTYRMAETPPVLEKVMGYDAGTSSVARIPPMTGEVASSLHGFEGADQQGSKERSPTATKVGEASRSKSQSTQVRPPGIRLASTGADIKQKKRRATTKHIQTGKGLPLGWISF